MRPSDHSLEPYGPLTALLGDKAPLSEAELGEYEDETVGGSNNRDKTTDSWWKKHGRACLCIVSGLLFSTVLVLVVIPLIYYASVRSQPVVLS